MSSPFLPNRIYIFLFALLGLVYIIGLFVPLMDNDSAHHADIALRMYLSGDYVNLIGHRGDYLDKPHLHFWLCAFSYSIFGVTGFAYKFPSFLFIILGIYSTYRIGRKLYNIETGKLAALLIASSFAYILAGNDVRMEALLTASIAFAIWQLVEFIQDKKIIHVFGSALGLALGFSTKGQIGVFVPAVAAFIYILYLRDWKIFWNWKWILLIVLFALMIFPVVYCFYHQYNLHPEKVVRGKTNINGVGFILLDQNVERLTGDIEPGRKNDYLFFIHSFLWAFAPWSIIAYIAVASSIKKFLSRKQEWLTAGVFIAILLVVSFSGFKLPHYLNIVFPTTAVLAAAFVLSKKENPKWVRVLVIIQGSVVLLLLLLSAIINAWAFPVKSSWIIVGTVLLLAIVFYFIRSKLYLPPQKLIIIPVAAMVVCFFLLNSNFYPQLLTYQGGNQLAFATKGKVDPKKVYYWKDYFNSSFIFYTATDLRPLTPGVLDSNRSAWVLTDIKMLEEIKADGYTLGRIYSTHDYEITRLNIKFLNPTTRENECTQLVLAEVLGKN